VTTGVTTGSRTLRPRQLDPRETDGSGDDALVTVLLACDPKSSLAVVRFGLPRHGVKIVAEAGDADDAVEAALRHRPQVCLLDVDTPGGWIAASDRINADLPGTKIALLSGSATREELRDAILAGADAYLPRSTAPDRLAEALKGLVRGEAAFPHALTIDLLRGLRPAPDESHFTLIADKPPQSASRVLFVPRLLRHFRRRARSGMPLAAAWSSARLRMRDYE
jgi:DNA-binding NarL/FixJ family response regulator